MKTIFVKKVLADGSPCKKCNEVIEKIEAGNQLQYIDQIVIADEANENSEGMQLAKKHEVTKAPFFIVSHDDGRTEVFTIYFKWVKDIVGKLKEQV